MTESKNLAFDKRPDDDNFLSVDDSVALRIRQRRITLGLSEHQIAESIGVTPSQYRRYESGKNRVSAGRIYQIAKALGVEVGYFFDDIVLDERQLPKDSLTLAQRMLIELVRIFEGLENLKYKSAILNLARVLAQVMENKNDQEPDLIMQFNGSIYLDSESIEDAEEIFRSTSQLLDELGYEIENSSEWIRGSWWRSFAAKLKRIFTNKMTKDRARIVEDVLFGRESLNVATGIAEATVNLMEISQKKKGTVVVDLGLFIFLKRDGENGEEDIYAKRLTVEERAFLDSDPSRVARPDEIMNDIKEIKRIRTRGAKRPKVDRSLQ